jgi:hypothetical protein
MENVELKYDEWCKKIADDRSVDHLISHLREHVSEHYLRHNSGDQIDLIIWLIGVLNFMHILEKKFPSITKDDMLFKLCRYYKSHGDGPEAPFDVDKFIKEYNGDVKFFVKKNKIN